jgi:hypothetical protein
VRQEEMAIVNSDNMPGEIGEESSINRGPAGEEIMANDSSNLTGLNFEEFG